jgi:hypothetical protein
VGAEEKMNISTKRFLTCIPDDDLDKLPEKVITELNRRKYKRARNEEEKRNSQRTGTN